ncbi:uncharacterized protein At3g17950-like [Juglans microcarpa x Juglans regia]|uniref:uncharacterized protein At3g17950-like n=1 Tax=Juglans microcarpa x Juglans regia TaxID=2249226 RepID=UPI001B7F1FE0|nr:uncharacterized protein At3g17950-like [Juglans microcarpa x Juglans regia]XP_041025636.1 uncharacterized protein At3g17950-like [Juglans microcarpa x Juglans regia]
MARQEEGWPLGLRPLNARVGLVRNSDSSGSISFSTLLTGSPTCSSLSSSDLDTESTGSFFHEKSITLGSLIGVSSMLELSRRSTRGRAAETVRDMRKNNVYKPKLPAWLFSLCSKLSTDAVNASNNSTPSLGHFLEAERRTAGIYRRNLQSPTSIDIVPCDFSSSTLPISDANSLFVGGQVAPQSSFPILDDHEKGGGSKQSKNEFLEAGNGYGIPLLFSCLRGYLIK